MVQVRIPLLLCVGLLVSATVPAMGAPELRSNLTTVNGVYSVTFNLKIASVLPAGSTITCRARIVPYSGGLDARNSQLSATPVDSAAGLATVTGSTATCTTEIPFSWTLTNEKGGVVLGYKIEAVSNSGTTPFLIRSNTQQSVIADFPASSGNTNLNFNLSF